MDNKLQTPPSPFYIWEGVYPSFKAALADASGPGFEGAIYQERSLAAATECMSFLRAGKPIPTFHKQRSTLLPMAVAMMLGQEEYVDILDFGGGLGIGFMVLAESIPMDLQRVRYTIVEGPHLSALGAQTLGNKCAYFTTLPASGKFSLIHAASSLQYIDNWQDLIHHFSVLNPKYILLSDVFAGKINTFATLQNYYGSRIPHWFLNLQELLEAFSQNGYRLMMHAYVTSRRLDALDVLPMDNFPECRRLPQSLHMLLQRELP